MLVLGLDTSTPAVSVALVELVRDADGIPHWGRSANSQRVDARRHGELLATGIAAVLREMSVSPANLDAVAVGLGPGPFTGLRVGVVTAAALSDALAIPAYGVCSLDAIAAQDDADDADGRRLVLADARRREVYWAEYDENGGRLAGPEVERPAELAERVRAAGWTGRLLGDGAVRYAEHFPGLAVGGPPFPTGEAVVLLAAGRALAGAPSQLLTPLYLRRPDAELPGPPKRVTA